MRIRLFFVGAALLAMTTFAVTANAQVSHQGQTELAAPLEPLRPAVTASQIFDELLAHNALRAATLMNYTASRTYQVVDLNGKVHAEEVGQMEYRAPDQKKFVVTSEKGSAIVRHLALNALIASEIETTAGKQHHDSAISPANYTLDLLGEQQVGPYHCFVAQAIPKRSDKYLFEGKVWIDAEDYAVVRIDGHPAKKLSFWIQRADFVRQYQKVDKFWLPQRDMTFVDVRLYGKKILTIDHHDYSINSSLAVDASVENTQSF
jgi:outer membrane lipoprotein-sorting protein